MQHPTAIIITIIPPVILISRNCNIPPPPPDFRLVHSLPQRNEEENGHVVFVKEWLVYVDSQVGCFVHRQKYCPQRKDIYTTQMLNIGPARLSAWLAGWKWPIFPEMKLWTAWVHFHRKYLIFRHELNQPHAAGRGQWGMGAPLLRRLSNRLTPTKPLSPSFHQLIHAQSQWR